MGKKKLTAKVFGLEFLKVFKALKPHQRSILVDHLNDAAINEIGRFVFNSFKTDLKLKGKAKKKCLREFYLSNVTSTSFVIPKNQLNKEGKGLKIKLELDWGFCLLLSSLRKHFFPLCFVKQILCTYIFPLLFLQHCITDCLQNLKTTPTRNDQNYQSIQELVYKLLPGSRSEIDCLFTI